MTKYQSILADIAQTRLHFFVSASIAYTRSWASFSAVIVPFGLRCERLGIDSSVASFDAKGGG